MTINAGKVIIFEFYILAFHFVTVIRPTTTTIYLNNKKIRATIMTRQDKKNNLCIITWLHHSDSPPILQKHITTFPVPESRVYSQISRNKMKLFLTQSQ